MVQREVPNVYISRQLSQPWEIFTILSLELHNLMVKNVDIGPAGSMCLKV